MNSPQSQYSEFRTEFDSLLHHAIAVLNAQAGYAVTNERENYGEKIFGKIVCHSISLGRLLPNVDPQSDAQLWDVSSVYAIARAIVESYEALAYVSDPSCEELELECRILLWKLHAEERRLKMLELVGSKNPAMNIVRDNIAKLREAILDSRYVSLVSKETLGKIRKGHCPPYLRPRAVRLDAVDVNSNYYAVVLMQLSQHVHAHPFSLHQLFDFRAGSADAYNLMKVAGQYACGFLAASVREISSIFAPRIPKANDSVMQSMELWCGILKSGARVL